MMCLPELLPVCVDANAFLVDASLLSKKGLVLNNIQGGKKLHVVMIFLHAVAFS